MQFRRLLIALALSSILLTACGGLLLCDTSVIEYRTNPSGARYVEEIDYQRGLLGSVCISMVTATAPVRPTLQATQLPASTPVSTSPPQQSRLEEYARSHNYIYNPEFDAWERSFDKHIVEISELSNVYTFTFYIQWSGAEAEAGNAISEFTTAYRTILDNSVAQAIDYEINNLPPTTGARVMRKFVLDNGQTATYLEEDTGSTFVVSLIVSKH